MTVEIIDFLDFFLPIRRKGQKQILTYFIKILRANTKSHSLHKALLQLDFCLTVHHQLGKVI